MCGQVKCSYVSQKLYSISGKHLFRPLVPIEVLIMNVSSIASEENYSSSSLRVCVIFS